MKISMMMMDIMIIGVMIRTEWMWYANIVRATPTTQRCCWSDSVRWDSTSKPKLELQLEERLTSVLFCVLALALVRVWLCVDRATSIASSSSNLTDWLVRRSQPHARRAEMHASQSRNSHGQRAASESLCWLLKRVRWPQRRMSCALAGDAAAANTAIACVGSSQNQTSQLAAPASAAAARAATARDRELF